MKHSGMTVMISALLFFFLFGFMILFVSGRTTGYLKQMKNQKTKIRAEESLNRAQLELQKGLEAVCRDYAEEEYEKIETRIARGEMTDSREADVKQLFQENFIQRVEKEFNTNTADTEEKLMEYLTLPENGELMINENAVPEFERLYDEVSGEMLGCAIKNVSVRYTNAMDYEKERSYSFAIRIPEVCIYDGNEALSDFSLIAEKGIYMTGQTSSVVGNIFAGTHQVGENRKAEAGYGEKELFGGLNILSTQLGVQADKIASAGDINLKGSFVLFGTGDEPTHVYANRVNLMDGYPTKTTYNIEGTESLRAQKTEVDEEWTEIDYMIKAASGKLFKLEDYYDSDNDEAYEGSYRIILSDSDITLSGDFTGIAVTNGNVIIEADCNIEGMIYAGDRIYTQGNNSIVSNREILRTLVREERENAKLQAGYEVSHRLTDYLAGIKTSGLYDQSFSYVELL